MTNPLERGIFDVASALEVPVLVVALVTLAVVVVEVGAFGVEVLTRRRSGRGRRREQLDTQADTALRALRHGRRGGVLDAVRPLSRSRRMTAALTLVAETVGTLGQEARLAKALADFDFGSEAILARTRLLVRLGPALGLMGTLIPLSPALDGLARGNVTQLTDNLRIAFSVTVLGLLVGALAFAVSLYRERFYGQDYSDLEYVAAALTDPTRVPAP